VTGFESRANFGGTVGRLLVGRSNGGPRPEGSAHLPILRVNEKQKLFRVTGQLCFARKDGPPNLPVHVVRTVERLCKRLIYLQVRNLLKPWSTTSLPRNCRLVNSSACRLSSLRRPATDQSAEAFSKFEVHFSKCPIPLGLLQ
jgi:hypothetical protein